MSKRPIFCFGSNLAGRHGAGAAKCAVQEHGAVYGQGYGLQGNSFAIPTKDEDLNTLPVTRIAKYVNSFVRFAQLNPEMTFQVTRIGCGLAGLKPEEVAPLFKDAINVFNIHLPSRFWENLSYGV